MSPFLGWNGLSKKTHRARRIVVQGVPKFSCLQRDTRQLSIYITYRTYETPSKNQKYCMYVLVSIYQWYNYQNDTSLFLNGEYGKTWLGGLFLSLRYHLFLLTSAFFGNWWRDILTYFHVESKTKTLYRPFTHTPTLTISFHNLVSTLGQLTCCLKSEVQNLF